MYIVENQHLTSNYDCLFFYNCKMNDFSIPCRNSISKVYPAMYIENVSELAFDDITPNDPDFASIQGESLILNLVQ